MAATDVDDRGLFWQLEGSHFPAPLTRWTAELYVQRQTAAIKEACEEFGLLMDGIAVEEFHGRAYTALVPLGGKVRKPPPAFLVPVLCRVVPPLRKRIKAARRTTADNSFDRLVSTWLEGLEQSMIGEARELLGRDLDAASGEELASALEAARDLACRGVREHFRLHGAGVWAIGRLGLALSRAGWSINEINELFTGLSDTSTGPAVGQAAIVDAVRAAGAEDALRQASSLEQVRAIGPDVAAALDDYLHRWAGRALRYEVAEATVGERPDIVLQALRDQLSRSGAVGGATDQEATRRAAVQRAVTALGGDEDARRRVDEAQRTFPIREGNETATIGMPVAAMRRVGLAIGPRLGLDRDDDVFDLWTDEVLALLRGTADAPVDAAGLARHRREARLAAAASTPPAEVGSPGAGPPPLAGFPADIAELVEALLWYTEKIFGKMPGAAPVERAAAPEGEVHGIAVSPGTYEGPARVVLDESGFDRIEPGDVLVCPITSPVWSMVFPSIGALVCDEGGPLSHPAIIAREFGIPAVVGTEHGTMTIADGSIVRVDGSTGTVTVVAQAAASV